MKLYFESLGCARNQVDSELMMGRFSASGFEIIDRPEAAEIVVVNTCSFIESAVNESIDTILELAKFKKVGKCRALIVVGCLPERFREDIADALPEVDLFLGTGAFDEIETHVKSLSEKHYPKCRFPAPEAVSLIQAAAPRRITSPHMAYIKVAEGCSKKCTYCIIPKLRGKKRSRPPEDIIEEAQRLIASGVRELVLIAQDTTDYGSDISPKAGLEDLLGQLAAIDKRVWIRFLYGHPESIHERILETVALHSNLCPYFDIPIQHASSPVLRRMGRNYSDEDLYRLFETIRKTVPGASLRTTVIVGFPGETRKDFDHLLSFVESVRFDHLGVFTYSDFDDLPSKQLSDHVPKKTVRHRHDLLMQRQREISTEINEARIGKTYTVLTEETPEENLYIGRTNFQAPEVDGLTYIRAEKLDIGEFIPVRITESFEYDLLGEKA